MRLQFALFFERPQARLALVHPLTVFQLHDSQVLVRPRRSGSRLFWVRLGLLGHLFIDLNSRVLFFQPVVLDDDLTGIGVKVFLVRPAYKHLLDGFMLHFLDGLVDDFVKCFVFFYLDLGLKMESSFRAGNEKREKIRLDLLGNRFVFIVFVEFNEAVLADASFLDDLTRKVYVGEAF